MFFDVLYNTLNPFARPSVRDALVTVDNAEWRVLPVPVFRRLASISGVTGVLKSNEKVRESLIMNGMPLKKYR